MILFTKHVSENYFYTYPNTSASNNAEYWEKQQKVWEICEIINNSATDWVLWRNLT